tara:strand:+ start:1225 stop:1425 length:201 start_codon:yes stop_codon:yes gene_type:complete
MKPDEGFDTTCSHQKRLVRIVDGEVGKSKHGVLENLGVLTVTEQHEGLHRARLHTDDKKKREKRGS